MSGQTVAIQLSQQTLQNQSRLPQVRRLLLPKLESCNTIIDTLTPEKWNRDMLALDRSNQQQTLEKHASILVPSTMVSMPRRASQQERQACIDASLNVGSESLLDEIW